MLGQAQAVANQPYQVYGGPLTAGESSLQSKVFQGLGSLNFPSNLGQSFSSSGAYAPPPMNQNAYGIQPIGTGGANGTISDPGRGAPTVGPDGRVTFGGMSGSGLPPYAMGQGIAQAPRTEQDWEQFQSLASFVPGTDMAKEKANFMSGNKGGYAGPELGAASASGMGFGNVNQVGAPANVGTIPPPTGIATGSTAPSGMTGMQPSNIAQNYMNPYLQSVLDPQLAELRRQNDITQNKTNAGLTSQGAFGGGRQAIMNAENNRNMMQEMNKTVGQGYSNAYDKGLAQFNAEQGQAKTLADLMAQQGATQRDIAQQGTAADYNEFLAQRDYPQKQLQFLQSMLQGLPISTVTNTAAQQTPLGAASSTIGGLGSMYDQLTKMGLIKK
jgi:hypothetical protein